MWRFRSDRPAAAEDFLLVTYDSCRFDTYQAAATPVVDRHAVARRAWSQATFTFPSHMAMFQGMLPHVFSETEFYNRFVRQLWRKPHRRFSSPPRVALPRRSPNIIEGFNRLGYYTCGAAAMAWFQDNPFLQAHFQAFRWTGTDARRQVDWLRDRLRAQRGRPWFGFINFGETHAPYSTTPEEHRAGGALREAPRNRKSAWVEEGWELDVERFQKQSACAEFLDARMGELLAFFSEHRREVTVVVCSDHGDCFGENGLWGHGFYHPKVMEVPMAIFHYRPDGTSTEPGDGTDGDGDSGSGDGSGDD